MAARVSDVQHVALAVPDLAAERDFFGRVWGLVEVSDEQGTVYFAAPESAHPFVISLRQDNIKKTDLIAFSADSRADVEALYAQALANGAKSIAAPAEIGGPFARFAARFFDPDGRAIEVNSGAAQRDTRELAPGEALPQRLSHIVLHSPDVAKLATWYETALGFRISDWIGEFMCFLRCNSAHHRMAILPGPPALNHIAFDVNSIDALMRGLARMTEQDVRLQWGPGRHTAGNNTFSYYETPNGNAVEYTSDLEYVDDATWQPTVYPFTPSITDNWGTGRIMTGAVHRVETKPDAGLWQVPA